MNTQKEISHILEEIQNILSEIEETRTEELISMIRKARIIYCIGSGRSKIILSAFCMRLQHLGYRAYLTGDLYCPPTMNEDLAIVATGSGQTTSTVALAKRFKEFGGKLSLLTGNRTPAFESITDNVILIPASVSLNYVNGQSIMRSGFEQALFIYLEAIIKGLSAEIDPNTIIARHANVE